MTNHWDYCYANVLWTSEHRQQQKKLLNSHGYDDIILGIAMNLFVADNFKDKQIRQFQIAVCNVVGSGRRGRKYLAIAKRMVDELGPDEATKVAKAQIDEHCAIMYCSAGIGVV